MATFQTGSGQWIVEIDGVEEVVSKLQAIGGTLSRGVQMTMDGWAKGVKDNMVVSAPRGITGGLKGSIDIDSPDPNTRVIGPQGDLGSKSHPLPRSYAFFVEKGARPHAPNIEDLKQRGYDDQAAFAIWYAVKRRGNKPQPFVQPVALEAEESFYRVLDDLVSTVIY